MPNEFYLAANPAMSGKPTRISAGILLLLLSLLRVIGSPLAPTHALSARGRVTSANRQTGYSHTYACLASTGLPTQARTPKTAPRPFRPSHPPRLNHHSRERQDVISPVVVAPKRTDSCAPPSLGVSTCGCRLSHAIPLAAKHSSTRSHGLRAPPLSPCPIPVLSNSFTF